MRKKTTFLFIAFLFTLSLFQSCQQTFNYDLKSPDGKVLVAVSNENEAVNFSVIVDEDDTVLSNSVLGILVNGIDMSKGVSILELEQKSVNETWNPVAGKAKTVENSFNQYILKCKKNSDKPVLFEIVFRCYNDGVAYRYIIPEQQQFDSLKVEQELSVLNFTNDFTFWAANGERHNLGPVKRSETSLKSIKTPLVIKTKSGKYLAIHEAAIFKFAPFTLNAAANDFSLKFNFDTYVSGKSIETSWRTLFVGDTPGSMVESNLLANLNPPCKIEDTSWIKPGRSMWDWRVWGYKAADGFEYGLNTISHKRFIDFAAANNIQYLLIDADWYGDEFSEKSDPTSAREGVNIEECMAYAKEKGVGVILYLNDKGAKKFGLERVLKQFADWGAAGVKYGFMRGKGQAKVEHTRKVVELCAKYKLMVDFHDGPIPPSGDRRTWPNLITKEFCWAQADAKGSYFPETAVSAPFINMIAGPLDMTNGWFGLNEAHSRERVFVEIPGTVVAEVAKLIVINSGLTVLPDSPEEYLKKDDLFDCIRKMPAQFDNIKVIAGEIGEFITVARKAGNNWFVGSLTNRESRELSIDLNFLDDNSKYIATIYKDTDLTDFLTNKESYKVENIEVNAKTKLKVFLAPGGGNAIYIEKQN
jgi:alpha-glucosidase